MHILGSLWVKNEKKRYCVFGCSGNLNVFENYVLEDINATSFQILTNNLMFLTPFEVRVKYFYYILSLDELCWRIEYFEDVRA